MLLIVYEDKGAKITYRCPFLRYWTARKKLGIMICKILFYLPSLDHEVVEISSNGKTGMLETMEVQKVFSDGQNFWACLNKWLIIKKISDTQFFHSTRNIYTTPNKWLDCFHYHFLSRATLSSTNDCFPELYSGQRHDIQYRQPG